MSLFFDWFFVVSNLLFFKETYITNLIALISSLFALKFINHLKKAYRIIPIQFAIIFVLLKTDLYYFNCIKYSFIDCHLSIHKYATNFIPNFNPCFLLNFLVSFFFQKKFSNFMKTNPAHYLPSHICLQNSILGTGLQK